MTSCKRITYFINLLNKYILCLLLISCHKQLSPDMKLVRMGFRIQHGYQWCQCLWSYSFFPPYWKSFSTSFLYFGLYTCVVYRESFALTSHSWLRECLPSIIIFSRVKSHSSDHFGPWPSGTWKYANGILKKFPLLSNIYSNLFQTCIQNF